MTVPEMTQQQRWGWEYMTKVYNDGLAARNASITERNRFLPRDQPLIPSEEPLSVEDYIATRVAALGDAGYNDLMRFKEQVAMERFRALPPEQQGQLLAQLEVTDVLTTEPPVTTEAPATTEPPAPTEPPA